MTAITKEYEPELKHFTDAMRYKLHVNRKKGKWEGARLDDLFDLLTQEVNELREAVASGNQVAIMLEAADIGNFAMMIANVAMQIAAGTAAIKPLPMTTEDRLVNLGYTQAAHLNASQDEIKAAIKTGV